ncbi:MAG: glutamine synthetase family protein [Arenibacterium sp.]
MSDIASGFLARNSLIETEAAEALLAEVAASDMETVRLVFADQHGILRGKTLAKEALRSAFTSGIAVPSTLLLKDTSHRTAFPVWSEDPGIGGKFMRGAGDILLVPMPEAFHRLPWAEHSAWLPCDVVFRDGSDIPFSPRSILRRATQTLADQGYSALMGLEIEFHVFRRVDPALGHHQTTMPGAPVSTEALVQGYQYLTDARYGEAEDVLDLLRRTAQAMNMPVRSIEIEMGPSQFEMTFEPDSPMAHADRMTLFRAMVKEVCAKRGLHASFMPRPRLENVAANGWHIHQSLTDTAGRNVFIPQKAQGITDTASAWLGGLLHNASAMSLLVAPTVNSYKRYQPYQLAPNRIAWGRDNRGAMLRALFAENDPASRIENRAPDSSANPHFAFAGQLVAGLDGLAHTLSAPPPTETPYDSGARLLPGNLGEAIDAFSASGVFRTAFGSECVDYLTTLKRFEWQRYLASISEWEQAEYFNLL